MQAQVHFEIRDLTTATSQERDLMAWLTHAGRYI
jgi:hypothetical protein